ncbi:hypothetical protein GCM10009744_50110 [Kribbella alba]|uniref:Uncharacterized protein n=1 Tax=Kribbella alba TaxID=190197 RepID=A0ABN2FLM2_9ACTN
METSVRPILSGNQALVTLGVKSFGANRGWYRLPVPNTGNRHPHSTCADVSAAGNKVAATTIVVANAPFAIQPNMLSVPSVGLSPLTLCPPH